MNPSDGPESVQWSSQATSSFTVTTESDAIGLPAYDGSRAIFSPMGYEPGYSYPLVVWLHGSGANEWQLMRIMPQVSLRNYVAVAPRGLVGSDSQLAQRHFTWPQSPDGIQAAGQRVIDAVQAVQQRFTIHPRRVFLAGLDCGGTMAFRVAMDHPKQFAGVLSIGGEFPRLFNPLHQLIDARRIPIFLAVRLDSSVYRPETACDDYRLLHTAGMQVTFRQYGGHQVTAQVFRDVNRWLMEQITRPSQSSGTDFASRSGT